MLILSTVNRHHAKLVNDLNGSFATLCEHICDHLSNLSVIPSSHQQLRQQEQRQEHRG